MASGAFETYHEDRLRIAVWGHSDIFVNQNASDVKKTNVNPQKDSYGSGAPKPTKDPKDDKNKTVGPQIKIDERGGNTDHIFRPAPGHLPVDTPANRKLIIDLVSDRNNYLGVDQHGKQWFGKVLDNGKQLWATVIGDSIKHAGINKTPRPWDPRTGLCRNVRK